MLAAYGLSAPSSQEGDDMIARKIRDDCVDFGDLNEPLQEQIIRMVMSDSGARRKMLDLNPAIPLALGSDTSGDVEHNRRVIQRAYSLEPSGRCLHDTYQNVLRAPASCHVSRLAAGELILSSFLDPVRFRLIRG